MSLEINPRLLNGNNPRLRDWDDINVLDGGPDKLGLIRDIGCGEVCGVSSEGDGGFGLFLSCINGRVDVCIVLTHT